MRPVTSRVRLCVPGIICLWTENDKIWNVVWP